MPEPSSTKPSKNPSSLSSSKTRSKAKLLKTGRPPLLSSTISKPASALNPHRSSLSSKRTRALIRTHHVLQKRLARARAENDTKQIHELEEQLAASGGLQTYQLASTVGQSAERGGDSSRVLVNWLRPEIEARRRTGKKGLVGSSSSASSPAITTTPRTTTATTTAAATTTSRTPPTTAAATGTNNQGWSGSKPPTISPLRILEIGALSTANALNMPHVTSVRRIDLRSSGPGIEEADFMHFPLPDSPDGRGEWQGQRGYDVISLSLVLNYVPDGRGRGEMLRRTTMFFARKYHHHHHHQHQHEHDPGDDNHGALENENVHGHQQSNPNQIRQLAEADDQPNKKRKVQSDGDDSNRPPGPPSRRLLPCLFLVLPAPTLHNSRYLTPAHLTAIMSSLGYIHLETKTTSKLHYSLWRYEPRRRDEWILQGGKTVFPKREINPGSGRNNFCIVLGDDEEEVK